MAVREAILEGTQAAQRLHAHLGTRKSFEEGGYSEIDVFRIASQLGAFLLFRPLKGLLGAYLAKPVVPIPGIIVTTQRDLHVQRFTAAHEIGHMYMGHEPSYDEQVGLWRGESKDLQEVAADAFASEFMLPRWLYIHHAKRHVWKSHDLMNPGTAYQLSLRLGASYDATCWGLRGHGILTAGAADKLREIEPKKLKNAALAGHAGLLNPWSDVWVITERDNGLTFSGGPDDLVIFRLRERASAGFLWDEASLEQQGLTIVADIHENPDEGDDEECGGEVIRVLVTRVVAPGEYRLSFTERRPWHPADSLGKLSIGLDFRGKEEGLSRYAKKVMAAA